MSGNDGDNPKSRGLKHVKNKKKYGRSRALPTAAPPGKTKSVPKLESNWDRYETEDVDQHQISSSTDFSILSSAPIGHGSHFQFKHDKEIDLADKNEQHFSLDLNLLNLSISTIPFYTRNEIDNSYFTTEEIRVFDRIAKDNEEKYNSFIEKNKNHHKNTDIVFCNGIKCDNTEDNTSVTAVVEEKSEDVTKTSGEPDLEQWLDDILDA